MFTVTRETVINIWLAWEIIQVGACLTKDST